MTEQNIPEWLKTWQSEFRTCFDVWKEQKEYALTHQVSIYPAKTNGRWKMMRMKYLLSGKERNFSISYIGRSNSVHHGYKLQTKRGYLSNANPSSFKLKAFRQSKHAKCGVMIGRPESCKV